MIYLTTGANGAGKTLCTLKDVREQQLKENRPVYYHGFDLNPETEAEFGWQKFDPKEWQKLPDGSICIMDECQGYFGVRATKEIPDYIQAMAVDRRKRGFDFWMICPHPTLLDVFIRRLIDKPSWHRHIKRAFGADVVSVLKFSSPDLKCESPGSGARGEVSMRPYPKEVYGWYRSASLHTGKRSIPTKVWLLLGCIVAFVALSAAGVYYVGRIGKHGSASGQSVPGTPGTQQPGIEGFPPGSRPAPEKLRLERGLREYAADYSPRINGLPHTAPVYDDLTKPSRVPVPAACLEMRGKCGCYTQQGTVLPTSVDLCQQIVRNGYFLDFEPDGQGRDKERDKERPDGKDPGQRGQLVASTSRVPIK